MKKFRELFCHSLLMVQRNKKSYELLSVTIILSFSILLSFFIYSDSSTYNKYKDVFRIPKSIITVGEGDFYYNSTDTDQEVKIKQKILIDKLEKMKGTQYYKYSYITKDLEYYSDNKNKVQARIFFVPKEFFSMYMNTCGEGYSKINILSGSSEISNTNDVVIDEAFFEMIPQNKKTIKTIMLPVKDSKKIDTMKKFNVIGVSSNNVHNKISYNDSGVKTYYVDVYISNKLAEYYDDKSLNNNIYINSPNNTNGIYNLCKELNVFTISSFDEQNKAREEIYTSLYTKGILAIVFIFLLGINLYSSFNNVLKERYFEIGVKRAIGAGKKDIIAQFFFEGIIIMVINTVISMLIVLDIFGVYKIIQKVKYNCQWIIYTSKYSIVIFIFSIVFLSLVFSILFAYKATKVEIISNLKSE